MHEAFMHVDGSVRVRVENIVTHGPPSLYTRSDSSIRKTVARESGSAQTHVSAKRGGGGDKLERRSGGIESVTGAVEQRMIIVRYRIAGAEGQGRKGVTHGCEECAGLGIEDHCSGASSGGLF